MAFSVKILGSSAAIPTRSRITTSQVVLYNQSPYLIDCGEGTQLQLRRFSVPFGRMKNIFISHIHGDHVFGLFGLLSTFGMLGRKQPLNIYAPKELKDICDTLFRHLEHEFEYEINFHFLEDGFNLILDDKNLEVYSFPLVHTKPTWGFLFREHVKELNVDKWAVAEYKFSISQILDLKKGLDVTLESGLVIKNKDVTTQPPLPKSYAYCSDTLPLKRLAELIPDVDVLYHESTYASDGEDMAKMFCHATSAQAAQVAKNINAKKLVLGHFSNRYENLDGLLEEARQIFPNTELAFDGLDIQI